MKKLLSMAAGGLALLASFSAFSADYLIDVRTPAEFSEGHLKGALNIEYQNILNGAEARRWPPLSARTSTSSKTR